VVAAVGVAMLVNPLALRVLHWGHPEDYLSAAALTAAAIAAVRDRPKLAGLLFGLALGSKQWSLLAAPLLLVAVRPHVRAFSVIALGVAVALYLPLAIGDSSRFVEITKDSADPQHAYRIIEPAPPDGLENATPLNVWWLVARPRLGHDAYGRPFRSRGVVPSVAAVGHGVTVLFAVLLAVLLARRRERDPADLLGVLALVFLLRSIFDPFAYDYHLFAFFVLLVTWEALRSTGPPVITLAAAIGIAVMLLPAPYSAPDVTRRATYEMVTFFAWALPLVYVLFKRSYATSVRNSGRPSESAVASNTS